MSVTGLYFIPTNSSTTTSTSIPLIDAFVDRFQAAYQDAALTGKWSMEHRLLRDTPSVINSAANPPRYMHFLDLSRFPTHAFIYTSCLPKKEVEKATAAAVAATKMLAKPRAPPAPVAPLPPIKLVDEKPKEPEPAEARPSDEQHLLQQQEMLFKQHREQQQQELRRQEEEKKAQEEEQRKLEEQEALLFASAGQQSRPIDLSASGKDEKQQQQQQQQKQEQQQQQQEKGAEAEANEPEEKKMIMVSVDTASLNTFYAMTLRAAHPLWVPRHTVTVPASSSSVFEMSDFVVRIGEVKQTAPATRTRGIIVEIEYTGFSKSNKDTPWPPLSYDSDSDGDADNEEPVLLTPQNWDVGEQLIREFWKRFAVPGAREYIRVKYIGEEARLARQRGVKRLTTWRGAKPPSDGITGVDLARQYMEVFRFSR
ncbi:hypothetical protein KEM56_002147 [Ascosphaera pollenicola]|nr:hypothetical protein KEM56_002147 [Ascosphaera pollenicola]